jgi:REP element-mobilizing transposase RayT
VRFSVRRAVAVDLTRPEVAEIVVAALRHHDGTRYWLYDYTVMPRHVHALLKPIVQDGKTEPLDDLLGSVKKWSARHINRVLGRKGPFWRDETWDRIIRNQAEYVGWARYVLDNAKAADLVGDALDWPWWGRGEGE